MQYGCFRFLLAFAAIMGVMHMIYENSYDYLFFPIVVIFWVIYTFFDEDDQEYLKRNPISNEDMAWLNNDYSHYPQTPKKTRQVTQYSYNPTRHEAYIPHKQEVFKEKYLFTKCKRSVKITIK